MIILILHLITLRKTGVLLEYHTIAENGVKSGKHRFYPRQYYILKSVPTFPKSLLLILMNYVLQICILLEHLEIQNSCGTMLSEKSLEQASSAGSRSVLSKISHKELSALMVTIPESIE